MKAAVIGMAAGLSLWANAGVADDLKADPRFSESAVGFDLKGDYGNSTLTIVGPGDFHASASARSGAPSIDLRRFGAVEDGTYTYQLTASTNEKVKSRTRLDDGRDARAAVEALKGVATTGTFNVKDGVIVKRVAKPDTAATARDRQD
jgi:hypothetical protein